MLHRRIPIVTLACLGSLLLATSLETSSVSAKQNALVLQATSTPDQGVPAYHEGAPQGDLPPVLDPILFQDPIVQKAYRLAQRLKTVLYQQPCYCYCDRRHGHGSLLDCYASKHTAGCDTCLKELFYVYEQASNGGMPEQIREGIIRGDWKTIDLNKYRTPQSNAQGTNR